MLWTKSLHLIFMVTWFAGLFYLPRLYVYHAMAEDQVSRDRFKVMERKLFWGITTPGGALTLLFGAWTLALNGLTRYTGTNWLLLKLILITLLVAYHVYCGCLLRDFQLDRNRRGHVWYRWFNEIPVLLLVSIILLSVLKPF